MIDEFARDTFAAQLGSRFQVTNHGADVTTLELIEVSERRVSGGSETFSIVMRGPATVFLPQATYQLQHEALGPLDLFIVPIGMDQRGYSYEAVFNRLSRGAGN